MPFLDPCRFTSPLRRFARTLKAGEPQAVAALPLPESRDGQSRQSVERAVAALGGERVEGWRLLEWPGLALCALHAVVWRDARGRLWNVQDEAAWLFVPDARLRPDTRPPLPRHQLLRRDALAEDFIRVREAAGRCSAGSEAALVLAQTVERLQGWLELGGRGDAPCPCQSGRRYALCCSPRLRASLQRR